MAASRVESRCRELGLFAETARAAIDPQVVARLETADFATCASFLVRDTWGGQRPSILSRVASCFCIPHFPFQCDVSAVFLVHQLFNSLPGSVSAPSLPAFLLSNYFAPKAPLPKSASGAYLPRWSCSPSRTTSAFPVKPGPGATNKVNVFLSEIMTDLFREFESRAWLVERWLWELRGRVTNDQAGAIVLYACSCAAFPMELGFAMGIIGVLDSVTAKGLSTLVKSCGLNGTAAGASVVELVSLLGRGVGDIDLRAEAAYRCHRSELNVFSPPPEALSAAIREVLAEEVDVARCSSEPVTSLEAHWSTRWSWAVNGAHSKLTDDVCPPTVRPPGIDRLHRRAWLESVETSPLEDWTGHTYVSASAKLEPGKTRAIFACDTLHYMRFEHLLARVESGWRGRRVVLDPGRGGTYAMVRRIERLRAAAGVSMMLDYDDFNSQHSVAAQREVIRQAAALVGYPPELTAPLLASFDKSEIYVGGVAVGYAVGTLMSGHRGTTFLNSVLNAAYLRVALGRSLYQACSMLHVGDDVFCGAQGYGTAAQVVDKVTAAGLRMNPLKQSVGHVSSEFLRVCTRDRDSFGYLARGVASVVNGNWVNDFALDPHEYLASVNAGVRSLVNRGGAQWIGRLFITAARRVCGLGRTILGELFGGATALGHGPTYGPRSFRREAHLRYETPPDESDDLSALPHFASSQYISEHATPVELQTLSDCGLDVFGDMVRASFAKSLASGGTKRGHLVVDKVVNRVPVGIIDVVTALRQRPRDGGLLLKYPLLVLAKERLPEAVVQQLVRAEGGSGRRSRLLWEAWAEYDHGVIINGALPYSDGASLGKSCLEDVVAVHHNIFM